MTQSIPTDNSIDRRRFLKRAGTIAWSTPLILSLMSEAAYASHPDGCIHLEEECGIYSTSTRACGDSPSGSGSTSNCCSPGSCQPTIRKNNQPCICQ